MGKTLLLPRPQHSPGPALPLAPTLNLSVNSRRDPSALPTPSSLSWSNLSEVGFVPCNPKNFRTFIYVTSCSLISPLGDLLSILQTRELRFNAISS